MAALTTFQADERSSGSGTGYFSCCQGSDMINSSTESRRQTRFRTAGTLSKMYVTILTNDRGASTFRLRKNAANGNQVLAIGASTTGEFEDAVNTDAIVSGDDVAIQTIIGGGGTTFTWNVARMVWSATVGTTTVYATGIGDISGSTLFSPIVGDTGSSGNELFNQIKMPTAGTFKNLGISVFTNTRDAATTFRFRVNEANVNQTVTIGAGATGWFEDLVNTDAVVVTDRVNYTQIGAGTAGLVTTDVAKIALETTNNSTVICGALSVTTAPSTTVYYPMGGKDASNATESNKTADSGLAFTASLLGIYLSSNTVVAASTFRLRKNAANANLLVSITGLTTGHFMDSVNSDSIIATDSLALQLETGAGGTSLTTRTHEMLGVTASSITGETLLLMGVG